MTISKVNALFVKTHWTLIQLFTLAYKYVSMIASIFPRDH